MEISARIIMMTILLFTSVLSFADERDSLGNGVGPTYKLSYEYISSSVGRLNLEERSQSGSTVNSAYFYYGASALAIVAGGFTIPVAFNTPTTKTEKVQLLTGGASLIALGVYLAGLGSDKLSGSQRSEKNLQRSSLLSPAVSITERSVDFYWFIR